MEFNPLYGTKKAVKLEAEKPAITVDLRKAKPKAQQNPTPSPRPVFTYKSEFRQLRNVSKNGIMPARQTLLLLPVSVMISVYFIIASLVTPEISGLFFALEALALCLLLLHVGTVMDYRHDYAALLANITNNHSKATRRINALCLALALVTFLPFVMVVSGFEDSQEKAEKAAKAKTSQVAQTKIQELQSFAAIKTNFLEKHCKDQSAAFGEDAQSAIKITAAKWKPLETISPANLQEARNNIEIKYASALAECRVLNSGS